MKTGKTKRPNILIISTDQQTGDALSCLGYPDLSTPAMDAIAEKGVIFRNCYCSNPICVPSRTSFITGCYSHDTGVTYNGHEFELQRPAITPALRAGGYDTGYVGKWHIPHPIEDKEWHGFDFIVPRKGIGHDPDTAEQCVKFIKQAREKPFFLFASFENPHDICQYARIASGIEDNYPNGDLDQPVPPPNQCPALPENFGIPDNEPDMIREHQSWSYKTYPVRDWNPGQWRQYRWAYNRLIEKVDAQIGKLLQALKDSGQEDTTAIIFTSDHGDGAGSHQWNQKTLFYDEVAKVPFILSYPGQAKAGTVDSKTLVNMNLDLFPTVFELAGIDCPEDLPGISQCKASEGESAAPRHAYVVSENDLTEGWGKSRGVFGRMVRTPRYKYVCYSKGEQREQFFDMKNDPGEMRSLAVDETHQEELDRHRGILRDWIGETGDFFPIAAIG